MNQPQFDVFLCHNSQDKPEVIEIANQLKNRGLKPWLDKWELRPGLPWQSLLEEQIEQIKSAAVFVGSSGFGPWQNQEMRAFLSEFVQRQCVVIPVLLRNTSEQPKLPIFLKGNTWVDFRTDPQAMEHLIWGITGNRPDEQRKPINQIIQTNAIQADDLSSEKGVDYTRLRDLLAAGKWQEADAETLAVMLKASGIEKEGWLNYESIENFPCTDLRTIDQLWVKYSNGRFGFSVQKKIYLSFGGKAGVFNQEAWEKYCDLVGWRMRGMRREYNSSTFNTSAPEGHLPLYCTWGMGGKWGRVTRSLLYRFE